LNEDNNMKIVALKIKDKELDLEELKGCLTGWL
jgi:hypothetical protein